MAWSATLGFADTAPRIAATARSALRRLVDGGLLTLHHTTVELCDPAPAWHGLRTRSSGRSADTRITDNDARLERLFRSVDLLATPTAPNPPHGHDGPGDTMSVAVTWAFNLSGHPAISIPAGATPRGEPVGLQLIAPHFQDDDLLGLAAAGAC